MLEKNALALKGMLWHAFVLEKTNARLVLCCIAMRCTQCVNVRSVNKKGLLIIVFNYSFLPNGTVHVTDDV